MQLNLRLAIWNANGLSNHTREVEAFLNLHFIDILLVSETHFTSRSHFKIRGYDLLHTNHPDNRAHAGACILIRNTIKYEVLPSTQEKYLQATNLKIKCADGDFIISSVYFPPRHNIKVQHYQQFFNTLGNKFLVGGDFNAKHPWWGSRLINPKGRELYKCVMDNHYSILSAGAPTYWPSDPRKVPDLLDFAVYRGISPERLEIKDCNDLSSDHNPLLINYKTSVEIKTSHRILTPSSNIELFQSWIDQHLNLKVSLKCGSEIEEALEHFIQLIHEAASLATPIGNKDKESHLKVSAEIREAVRNKRRLRSEWQRRRYPAEKRLLNKARRDLETLLNEHKNTSTGKFFDNINNSTDNEHLVWKCTKYLKRPVKRKIPIKNTDGSWCQSDKDTAEAFAKHLETIFMPFDFNSVIDKEEIAQFLDSPCQMDLPIKKITPSEIRIEISKLNKKKSPGYDLIDGFVAKSLTKKSIVFLTYIYNSILNHNYFPIQWKCAQIIMIPKPNKPENLLTSYRPISLLATFSKIFEKLFCKRLVPILAKRNIIPEHQFGFRHKHGTPEQCHRVVNVISETFEKKQYCSATFLDVQQAFDRVWHKGLLYKIKSVLPAPYFLFFQNYLCDRFFYVNTKDTMSDIYEIKAGIPQGSVLGPILYTIYMHDMPTTSDTTIATYADDTAILAASTCPTEASTIIQSELNLLQEWLLKWNIKVNSEKSQHMTFTLRRGDCPSVNINNEPIPKVENVKYLGLTLDRRLNWKPHIKSKIKQLKIKTQRMFWLLGPRSQLNLNNKTRLYKAVLKPVWTYGIQIWGTASYSNIDIIERYQSKTLRQITNAPWFITNKHIRQDLKISPVREEISKFCENYLQRLSDHVNPLAIALLDESTVTRRLKRVHVLDLPFRS